ncbi:MAG: mandelate racemase/muconate lactonizing enzyme family protein [Deltaproteobacteria bacterium]|nr:mandelate racemase/muconate lactonizing enzyme family protein [Deltaproteobacteria bacterium]
MKITGVETLFCDAGWRPWIFLKISTDQGLVGWSEVTDSHGSPRGIAGVVEDLAPFLLGADPLAHEKLYWDLYRSTRQSPGSIIAKAIGGIENALLDLKGKALGVSVAELFGGPLRDRLRVYWSHCGTSRVRAYDVVGEKRIADLAGIREMGAEVAARGFTALKTNVFLPGTEPPIYMPGFKTAWTPELNVDRGIIRACHDQMAAFQDGAGPAVDLIMDLNFNFKTEGYIQIARALEPLDLLWVELDTFDPQALRQVRDATRLAVASCENLYHLRQFLPFLTAHAMDVCVIDVIWNGFAQAKKISDAAEVFEMNVAPHNYQSHLSTFISAQFCAAVPNFRIFEVDVDDVPWKDELTTRQPEIEDGFLSVPTGPGWGVEVNEEVLAAHPWPR